MKLSKLDAYGQAIGRSAGCFTYIGVLVVALVTLAQSFKLLEHLVLNHLYGPNAWANGLHVVDKHGTLSNGAVLSGWPHVIVYFGSFLGAALCFISSYFIFGYIGMRLKGRRPSDPPPKKKWQSSNNPPRTARRD